MENNKKRYKVICPICGETLWASKNLGMEKGWTDWEAASCLKCDTRLALIFDPVKEEFRAEKVENYASILREEMKRKNEKTLSYNTRDEKGRDIVKEIAIKSYAEEIASFYCKICGKEHKSGIPIKKIVSSNFTDWQYVGDFACSGCSQLFSFFPYNYIQDKDGIRLLNIREMAEEIKKPQKPPFRLCITKSQKKHLFYKSCINYDNKNFIANLEGEQIAVDIQELKELFWFVENLLVLGESKQRLSTAKISYETLRELGKPVLDYLVEKLKQRTIQIPLHLAQKPEIKTEVAKCNLNLILKI